MDFLDFERFIANHRACGTLAIEAPECDSAIGFPVSVVCDCGEVLARWITLPAAFQDVIGLPWPSTAS